MTTATITEAHKALNTITAADTRGKYAAKVDALRDGLTDETATAIMAVFPLIMIDLGLDTPQSALYRLDTPDTRDALVSLVTLTQTAPDNWSVVESTWHAADYDNPANTLECGTTCCPPKGAFKNVTEDYSDHAEALRCYIGWGDTRRYLGYTKI
jgi:hypothetical protein